jgi:hypothetical protein
MTPRELAALQAARPEVSVTADPIEGRTDLVRMRMKATGGCPYLARALDGTASCTVHAVRPYQCRRFMCGRPDPSTEPFEVSGPMGCRNLSDRIESSYQFAAFYRTNQRHAQRDWAEPMGWQKRSL